MNGAAASRFEPGLVTKLDELVGRCSRVPQGRQRVRGAEQQSVHVQADIEARWTSSIPERGHRGPPPGGTDAGRADAADPRR